MGIVRTGAAKADMLCVVKEDRCLFFCGRKKRLRMSVMNS